MMPTRERLRRILLLAGMAVLAAACSGANDDLLQYVDQIKARPGGRIQALPQIKPYETFAYAAETLRSPFAPDTSKSRTNSGPRPEANRPKEFLEQFPLDTMKMVGTLKRAGNLYGLVKTTDGMVHRVVSGNYVGQNDGRVTAVSDGEIRVEELVPDGIGGFYKRSAAIALAD
jgi:type IV pilus assembly protein PilP